MDAAAAGPYPLAALLGALAIPAQCAEIEHPECSTAADYQRWFDTWVAPTYIEHPDLQPVLDGETCYAYRLALRRNGHRSDEYLPVRFVVGHPDVTMHRIAFDGVLHIEIRPFVRDVIEGAERWLLQYMETNPSRPAASAMLAAWFD
ncbi:hypothetical protein FOZ76_02700 [Verticiella sediminum]|uniref:Uncharacterized protein n=1 Tax=Verticiella sediminum TaxID=1247510 RepID=A0A556B0I7_9BURK|nr:hypothetical protein [Verticiella sediminum]TSH98673.1 hypothetical protein FOZ76_02700 [Verticiella sediminum]